MMTVYLLAQIEIEDPDEYRQYLDGFFPVFEKFNGEFLASDPATEVIEGEWAYPRTAIMKFPSEEDAKAWHDSAEYQQLARHRWASARSNLVMVRGPRD
jgi:uncharacterized protein (DUF1330 family)